MTDYPQSGKESSDQICGLASSSSTIEITAHTTVITPTGGRSGEWIVLRCASAQQGQQPTP